MNPDFLPEKTLRLWQLRIALLSGVPVLLCLWFLFWSRWLLLPALLLAALALWLIAWYLPRYFKSYDLRFPHGAVVIHRGVFIRTAHIMPFSKLIYVQSISTPLSKTMGLAALNLKAARSHLLIPEIPVQDAELFIQTVVKPD